MAKKKSVAAKNRLAKLKRAYAKSRCIAAIKQALPDTSASQEEKLLPAIAIACVEHSFAEAAHGYEVVPTATCIINDAIHQVHPEALTNCKLQNVMQRPLLSKVFTLQRHRCSISKYAIDMRAVLPNASRDIRSILSSVDWQSRGSSGRDAKPVNNKISNKHQLITPPSAPGQQSNFNQPLVRLCAQPKIYTVIAASAQGAASLPAPFSGIAARSHMRFPDSPEALPFPRSARSDALFATSAHQTACPNTQLPIDAAAMQSDSDAAQSLRQVSQTDSVLDESVHSLLQLLPGAVRLPVLSHLCKLSLNR